MRRIIGYAIVTMFAAWPALTAPANAQTPPAAPAPPAAPTAPSAPASSPAAPLPPPAPSSPLEAAEPPAGATPPAKPSPLAPAPPESSCYSGYDYSQPVGGHYDYSCLGEVVLAKGDVDGALADFTKAIEDNPQYVAAYRDRGYAYLDKGEWDLAIADFTKAIEISPKVLNKNTYIAIGYAYFRKDDFDHAVDAYNRAIERFGKRFPDAYRMRCLARALSGKVVSVVDDCKAALKLVPNDPDLFDARAYGYVTHSFNRGEWNRGHPGQLPKAVADYTIALSIDPKRAGSLYSRGLTKIALKDTTGQADICAAKAIQRDIAQTLLLKLPDPWIQHAEAVVTCP
jgi:tetratricopeptide (TPR) repeat protein